MKHKVYTVYDQKSEAYLMPFFMQTNASAIRAITDLVNDPQHTFGKHPADYSLFLIGEFEDDQGILSPGQPFCVGKLIEFQTQQALPFPELAANKG